MPGGLMLDGRCSIASLDDRFFWALRSDARRPAAQWPRSMTSLLHRSLYDDLSP